MQKCSDPALASPRLCFPRTRRGLASAAKDNGGLCSFPYCACWTDFPSECLHVTSPTTVNNTYSFTILSQCDEPLGHGCEQSLHKLEFNSCE